MAIKSGLYWVAWANTHACNSSRTDDLVEPFRSEVKQFITALAQAGATVTVRATKRSARRAYLFHWSWMIALGKCKPSAATRIHGVDIQWDHGNDVASRKGAQQMVDGFGLAVPPGSINPPAMTSNHIAGKAVDMEITWTGSIKVKDKSGKNVTVPFMANVNANAALQAVGASYGVKKLVTDAPHWSFDGH